MFGNFFMRDYGDDPFFSSHREHMQRMNDMMRPFQFDLFRDPFAAPLSITDGAAPAQTQQNQGQERVGNRRHELMPQRPMDPFASPFGDMFGNMNRMMQSMMGNMNQMMVEARNNPEAGYYSQSSVMTYSNTGEGQPRMYQATTSTRQAPGGVKETTRSVRDSESGLERMAIGRHVNDRAHVVTRTRNTRTNDHEETQDYINLDESEARQFDQEWQSRAGGGRSRHRGDSQRSTKPPPYTRNPPPKTERDPPAYCPSPMEGLPPVRGKAMASNTENTSSQPRHKEPSKKVLFKPAEKK